MRFIAALLLLLTVAPALAQDAGPDPDDPGRQRQLERMERREERRQERIERRQERRERIEQLRERLRNEGIYFRLFRDYTLPEGATATEQVVVIGGTARIDGHLEDDVVVIGGSLRLGPKAVVDGNVVTVGGGLTLEPGATVNGTIDEAVVPWPSVVLDPGWDMEGWGTTLSIGATTFRLLFVLAISALLTLVAPGWIAGIAGRPAGCSDLVGLTAEILFVPALVVLIVALAVSIVGIPLLAAIPFLLAAFGILWVAGFTGVAVRLGRALRGSGAGTDASVSELLLGYIAIVAVTVIGHVLVLTLGWLSPVAWPVRYAGLLIEYLAWTIGLGAAVTSLLSAPRMVPPPVPTQSGL